jgi:glycosyltransferase involved in cell wall biosynthesis
MAEPEYPLVSVGLVTYNRSGLLRRAIESVLRQSMADYELIISDDNSSDDTFDIVRPLLQDKRVRYIKRAGVGMTQNFIDTLKDARGEYFIWLCDDDYFSQNYLRCCLDFLSGNPDYSLACGETKFTRGSNIIDRHEWLDLRQGGPEKRLLEYFRRVNSNIILYGLMRREEALKCIYPDTFCADLLWTAQIVFMGKTRILQEATVFYSLEGISEKTSSLKSYYKKTRNTSRNPYYFLLKELLTLIFNKQTVFRPLPFENKLLLSAKLCLLLRERFMMPAYEAKVRGALRIRTRLKSLFR